MDISRKDKDKLDRIVSDLKKKQGKFDKLHKSIQKASPDRRAYEYAKQQAKVACSVINNARSSGFSLIERMIIDAMFTKVNAHKLYIKEDEYGKAIIDQERLNELILS